MGWIHLAHNDFRGSVNFAINFAISANGSREIAPANSPNCGLARARRAKPELIGR
jgi:hypothetical protein